MNPKYLPRPHASVPIFVHCWACRLPVTPSGRASLLTTPAGGDPARLCELTLATRSGVDVPRESYARALHTKAVRR